MDFGSSRDRIVLLTKFLEEVTGELGDVRGDNYEGNRRGVCREFQAFVPVNPLDSGIWTAFKQGPSNMTF